MEGKWLEGRYFVYVGRDYAYTSHTQIDPKEPNNACPIRIYIIAPEICYGSKGVPSYIKHPQRDSHSTQPKRELWSSFAWPEIIFKCPCVPVLCILCMGFQPSISAFHFSFPFQLSVSAFRFSFPFPPFPLARVIGASLSEPMHTWWCQLRFVCLSVCRSFVVRTANICLRTSYIGGYEW